MRDNMKEERVLLNESQRSVVEKTIAEVCDYRGYDLKAINVRSNHAHIVVSVGFLPSSYIDRFFKSIKNSFASSGEISSTFTSRNSSTTF